MTTLGFGDVAPKTFAGKLLTAVCVIIGLLKLSLLTGTLISVVTETGSLSIKDQQVVVKNGTTEQMVAETKFYWTTMDTRCFCQVIPSLPTLV